MKIKYKFKQQPKLLAFLIVSGRYPVKFIYKRGAIIVVSAPQTLHKLRYDRHWAGLIKRNRPSQVRVYD